MAKEKQYIVFGLGKFGMSVAKTIAKSGHEVLAVDKNEELVNSALEVVTHAVQSDVTDKASLDELGVNNFDVAVNAIGTNLEASIMMTLLLKDYGVKHIVAKAKTDMHQKVLEKIGADRVIQPEKEMGNKIGANLISEKVFDFIELSDEYSIARIGVLKDWIGKSLRELNVRSKYKINVIAIRHKSDKIDISPNPELQLNAEDSLIVIGEDKILDRLKKMMR